MKQYRVIYCDPDNARHLPKAIEGIEKEIDIFVFCANWHRDDIPLVKNEATAEVNRVCTVNKNITQYVSDEPMGFESTTNFLRRENGHLFSDLSQC